MTESAVPILPSRDLAETLAFYERLGFRHSGGPWQEWGYLIIARGGIELHFWHKPDVDPLTTDAGCYLRVLDAGVGDVVRAEPFDAIALELATLWADVRL